MKFSGVEKLWGAVLLAVVLALTGPATASAQSTTMPTTLRWGTGYIDVPMAGVTPHMAVGGTFSAFRIPADVPDEWKEDGVIFLGLFDRAEVGLSLQAISDDDDGGNMIGGWGHLNLIQPDPSTRGGFGLAVGARFVSDPSFDAGATVVDPAGGTTVIPGSADFKPGRLGFPDPLVCETGHFLCNDEFEDTNFTPYIVGTAYTGGILTGFLPENDLTVTLGWGSGLFREGDGSGYYNPSGDSQGVFGGLGLHFGLGSSSLLHLMGDWNGFDLNFGAQIDWAGLRIGGVYLGANHEDDRTAYDSQKWGFLASASLCPLRGEGLLCAPTLPSDPAPDTVRVTLPPDTVVVERDVTPELPTGRAVDICLATGESVRVLVTADNDTLVGPDRVSIAELRPGVVFAGTYAEGRAWFEANEAISFESREYLKSGGPVRMDCPDLVRIGEYRGVPLFARRGAERPYETIYVPVRPGIFQPYERGLRRTTG